MLSGATDANTITQGDAILDVRYTLDGVNWTTIGSVDSSDWQTASFTIQDPNVQNWSDISKLQRQVEAQAHSIMMARVLGRRLVTGRKIIQLLRRVRRILLGRQLPNERGAV